MIVAIHQPNFFPWLGYFDKMSKVDVFVLLDSVQFTKGGFQNRVQLKGSSGPQWLSVPVITKDRYKQATLEVLMDPKTGWRDTHLKTFKTLYGPSKGFKNVYPLVEEIYSRPDEPLVDFTIAGIRMLRNLLGITAQMVRASELEVNSQGSDLLHDLVKAVGGTTYLSGPSGRKYLDESVFSGSGINVKYHLFSGIEYTQRFGEFENGLSTLDYVFNDFEHKGWTDRGRSGI